MRHEVKSEGKGMLYCTGEYRREMYADILHFIVFVSTEPRTFHRINVKLDIA